MLSSSCTVISFRERLYSSSYNDSAQQPRILAHQFKQALCVSPVKQQVAEIGINRRFNRIAA